MSKNISDSEKFAFEMMDALKSPVLTHSSMWSDCIPGRLLKVIPLARLAQKKNNNETATDEEAVAFIMTRTMEAPMNSDWTEIYIHLSCKVCERWWQENHWDELQAQKELNDYQRNYLLAPLLRHIYDKRRDILKKRIKESSISVTKNEIIVPESEEFVTDPPKVEQATQLTMF